jgi:hypothetical protein
MGPIRTARLPLGTHPVTSAEDVESLDTTPSDGAMLSARYLATGAPHPARENKRGRGHLRKHTRTPAYAPGQTPEPNRHGLALQTPVELKLCARGGLPEVRRGGDVHNCDLRRQLTRASKEKGREGHTPPPQHGPAHKTRRHGLPARPSVRVPLSPCG